MSKTTPSPPVPTHPGRSMTITSLRIHPIKSCRGIAVDHATLTRRGLLHDRKWMFVDAANKFLTIRAHSRMTLITTAINPSTGDLEFTLPAVKDAGVEAKTLRVPLDPTQAWLEAHCDLLDVEIWEFETDAWTYRDPTIKESVTAFFKAVDPDSEATLVMKGPTPREARGNGAKAHLGRRESVNFPDVLPIQVASEASMRELNSRLRSRDEGEITIERFRPNIIVDGAELEPWEEDEWKTLRINPPHGMLGNVISMVPGLGSEAIDLDVSARCARCQVPNVDPDTAVKHPREPWSVLYSYRRVDEGIKVKPCFGMLCCPRGQGRVGVGMTVEVREVMEPVGGKGRHRYVKGF